MKRRTSVGQAFAELEGLFNRVKTLNIEIQGILKLFSCEPLRIGITGPPGPGRGRRAAAAAARVARDGHYHCRSKT